MEKILLRILVILVTLLPLTVSADATKVGVDTMVNNQVRVDGTQFNQEFNGSTGVVKSLSGGVTTPYLNMQQATTPHPVGNWRPIVLPPRSNAEIYSREELTEIIGAGQDIFQVAGKLRIVVPKHDKQFIYTLSPSLNLVSLGLVPLLTVEGEAPPNANMEEHLLRLQSISYQVTNSFVTTAECTEDILNKYANNGGGVSGGGAGFLGTVLTSSGIAVQDSVAVSRAYRVPKCRVTSWSTNIDDLEAYTKQASAQSPELLYNLYLYKDKEKQQAEFTAALSRVVEDEQFLKRLRQGSEIDFVAFYLKEIDKVTVQSQIESFQQEFSLRLKEKGITTFNWKSQLLLTDADAPAQKRTDITGGLALYH